MGDRCLLDRLLVPESAGDFVLSVLLLLVVPTASVVGLIVLLRGI